MLFLMYLLLLNSAHSQNLATVFVKAPQVSQAAFLAEAIIRPNTIRLSQMQKAEWQTKLPKTTARDFANLQEKFLTGDNEQLSQEFETAITKIRQQSMGDMERQTLHYLYLRQAQLSLDTDKRKQLLQQALVLGPEISPETDLFPPPLITEYNNLKKSHPLHKLSLEQLFPGSLAIVANGKWIENTPGAFLIYGEDNIQVSVFSDDRPFFAFDGDIHQASTAFKKLAFIAKDCSSEISPQYNTHPMEVYFADLCPEQKSSKQIPKPLPLANSLNLPAPQSRSLLDNKWFWLSAAAIASGFVIYQNTHSRDKEIIPTTTESFF